MTAKIILVVPILLLFINCKSSYPYQEISFKNPYKLNSEILEELENDTVGWKYQISAGEYAIKGNYKNALKQWDFAFPHPAAAITLDSIDSIVAKYKIVNALDYIVEKAKSHQIVILNEAHHNSSHRVFAERLILALSKIGYTNLGLEALTNGEKIDSLLNKRGYPIQNSGYYTQDPRFGNLIRTALKNGYTVFPYERTSKSNGKEREIEQAKNIIRLIDKKPNEKFIIYCGFDHVLEGNVKTWEKALAGRLHDLTGINPLTINQTKYSERSRPLLNNPLIKALNVKEPSILIDNYGEPLNYVKEKSYTDIAVFHPVTKYFYGRPNWLFYSGKKDISIALNDLKISFPVMVLAYLENEVLNLAVPLDIIEVQSKNESAHLALSKGEYKILINNKSGKSLIFNFKVK